MEQGNCTNYIPIQLNYAGEEQIGYLDPKENVVHTDTYTVECNTMNGVLLSLNGTTHAYYVNGTIIPATSMGELTIPNINLGIQPIEVDEIIFSRAHRLNWKDMNDYRSLNHLLATLDRQRQVLRAMGISISEHRTLESNVIESREDFLGGAFFAFLTGGHVASLWEVWTLLCDIAITVYLTAALVRIIIVRCCLPRIRARRLAAEEIAAVDVEGQPSIEGRCAVIVKCCTPRCRKEPEDVEEVEEIEMVEPTVNAVESDNADSVSMTDEELDRQYAIELELLAQARAPPPYTPIYPQLPPQDDCACPGYNNHAFTQ